MLYFKAEKKPQGKYWKRREIAWNFPFLRSVATLVFTRNEIQPVTEIRTDIILY